MNQILLDTSIWIEYFRYSDKYSIVSELIKENQICINELILAELMPYLYVKKENEIIESLKLIEKIEIRINWEMIIQMQIKNLKNGINKVGIPDLILAQNVIDNDLILFTIDKHFIQMKGLFEYRLFDYKEKKT
ncbi:MAG TPA: PIN domain-containing protein [Spirochaetales bacterium]|nr:PIN domain-containing protein [Spirochaetales bacterium]